MKSGDKLYIVTRKDIDPGYQAVQSIHAMRQFSAEHKEADELWFKESSYLALLAVENEKELLRLAIKAYSQNIKFSAFFEPDADNEVTAVAFEACDLSKELCKSIDLALRQ